MIYRTQGEGANQFATNVDFPERAQLLKQRLLKQG
jgi:hypothetical protein